MGSGEYEWVGGKEWAENPKSNIAWKEVGICTWGSREVGGGLEYCIRIK